MSGNYNSVPPPPNLKPSGSESTGGGQDSFADAIAKARAIAAKMQEQHGAGSKQEDSHPRKRGFQDDPMLPREHMRSYYGQEAPSGPPHYGLGSQERYDQTSGMPSVYGQAPAYGSGGVSEDFPVPSSLVGLIIGRAGETLKRIQNLSGAKVTFAQDHNPNDPERTTTVSGTQDAIRTAREMIDQLIRNHFSKGGGVGVAGRGLSMPGSKDIQLPVPGNRVGLIIGKGGETIRDLIEHRTDESIERAKALILAIVSGEINTARGSIASQSSLIGIQPGQEKVVVKVPNDKVGSPESVESAKALIYEKIDGPGAYTSQYESQSSYGGYGYSAAMPPMQPYGAYPYYPVGPGYPYQPTSTSRGDGQDKTKSEVSPQTSLPEGASAADQEAYANYFKQLNDYYAAYYASLGYSPTQPKADEDASPKK
ncbi:hypothetical protein L0F63_003352 [Massospora cicadina]|nr:hypothetical protein L0F63_003352 [Massospora cicadina]